MFDDNTSPITALRTALDDVDCIDPSTLSDPELEAAFAQMERAAQRLEAQRGRLLAEIDRRKSFRRSGHLSTTAWLVDRFRASGAAAAQQVRVARALEEMPRVREALSAGEVSTSAARVLVDAREEHRQAFDQAEPLLVQAARSLPVRQLSSAVSRWSEQVDAGAAEERARRLRERRHLSVFGVPSGMVRVEGELDPENGQVVVTALRAMEDAWIRRVGPREARTGRQRRADAMGELCRQWLGRSDRPAVGGERPHLVVAVSAEALASQNAPAHLPDTGSISAEAARRVACDASLTRVVLRAASQPLDIGRRTPLVPPAIRRALVIRDQGCRFEGCDRPPDWCDAHHIRHWADGGETKLENLALLCRPHHGMGHEGGGFHVEWTDGKPLLRRADPSTLEGRAPP